MVWGHSFGHYGYVVTVWWHGVRVLVTMAIWCWYMVAWGQSFGHHGYLVLVWWHGVRVLVTMAIR